MEQESRGTKAPPHGGTKPAYDVNVADVSAVRDDVQGWLIDRLPQPPTKTAKAKAAQTTATVTAKVNANQASAGAAGAHDSASTLDGMLHIWEAAAYFEDVTAFCKGLGKLGFDVMAPATEGAFMRIYAVKNAKQVDTTVTLPFRGKME